MPLTAAAISAGAQAGASIINNTVQTLAMKPVLKQQIESMKVQDRLAVLSNTQKDVLAIKLQAAQTDTERMKLILNAANQVAVESVDSTGGIYEAAVKAKSAQNLVTVVIIVGSIGMLLTTLYLLKSKKI